VAFLLAEGAAPAGLGEGATASFAAVPATSHERCQLHCFEVSRSTHPHKPMELQNVRGLKLL